MVLTASLIPVPLLGRTVLFGMRFDLSDAQRLEEMQMTTEVATVDLDILGIEAVGQYFGSSVAAAAHLDFHWAVLVFDRLQSLWAEARRYSAGVDPE